MLNAPIRNGKNKPEKESGRRGSFTGIDVDEAWRQKVAKLRKEQGFVEPGDKLNEMPGRFILLLLWTGAAGWLLVSTKGKAIANKYLAEARQ